MIRPVSLPGGLPGGLLGKVLLALSLASLAGAAILTMGLRVVRVEGTSMEPALSPGDRVLALTLPGLTSLIDERDLVLAAPATANRAGEVVIKRVMAIEKGAKIRFYTLAGDNAERSLDSREYGLVPESRIRGLVIWVF